MEIVIQTLLIPHRMSYRMPESKMWLMISLLRRVKIMSWSIQTDQSAEELPDVEHVQLSCIRPRPSAEKPVTKLELSVERFVSMSAKSTASFLEYTWLSTIRNGLVDVCNATAYILCDALWAIEAIDNTDVCIPPHLFKRLKASCHVLVSSGIHIKLINIPGNSGIEGNVEADKRAKDTAYHIYKGEITASINVSMKTAFNLSREIATRSWQRMWDNDQSGRYTHNLIPSVNCKILFPLTRDIGIS